MDLELCAWCPRLCRHVCPVSVATGFEASTPTAMATAAWLRSQGHAVPQADLCLSCGACAAHCAIGQPAGDAFRALFGRAAAATLSPIVGEGTVVDVLFPDDEDTETSLRTPDALGHGAWKSGDDGVLARVARLFAGRSARVRHGDVAEVLTAAGVSFERVAAPVGGRPFLTCWSGAPSGVGQLACCGRREQFAERAADAAHAVAAENVRRMDDTPHTCDDAACARWLRDHGARIEGPHHASTPASPLRRTRGPRGPQPR